MKAMHDVEVGECLLSLLQKKCIVTTDLSSVAGLEQLDGLHTSLITSPCRRSIDFCFGWSALK